MLTRRGIVLTWPTLIVVGIVGVLAYGVVRAQRQDPPALTAQDRLEIQELLHRYMFILDSCPDHNSGYDYADLYTEDGQFASQDIQFGMTVKGRDALATLAGRTADGGCSPIRRRGPTNQIHLNLAPLIEPAEVPTTMAASRASQPSPRSSAASTPAWNAPPTTPPPPSTRPTRTEVLMDEEPP